jgi:Arc/MetJ-type ribon-helix-helix transcriptional regulator
MQSAEKISITLPPDLLRLIREAVAAGEYASTSKAVRAWQRQRLKDAERFAALRPCPGLARRARPSLSEAEADAGLLPALPQHKVELGISFQLLGELLHAPSDLPLRQVIVSPAAPGDRIFLRSAHRLTPTGSKPAPPLVLASPMPRAGRSPPARRRQSGLRAGTVRQSGHMGQRASRSRPKLWPSSA